MLESGKCHWNENDSMQQAQMQHCFAQIQQLRFLHVRRYVNKSFLNSYRMDSSVVGNLTAQGNELSSGEVTAGSQSNPTMTTLAVPDHWPLFSVRSADLNKDSSQQRLLEAFTTHLNESESIALVPILGTKHQLIFFEQDSQLQVVLLQKFNLVLDIDDTLISTRVPTSKDEPPKENEQDLFVPVRVLTKDNTTVHGKVRFLISKREGVSDMLRWACQLFNVSFITNGAYIYARAVLHYLDPDHQHILKYVGHDETALRDILKSREDLLPHSLSQKIGLKKLQLFGLPLMRSVILDDDKHVWHESNQCNLLPFERIVAAENKTEYLERVASFIWKHLEYLSTKTPEESAAVQSEVSVEVTQALVAASAEQQKSVGMDAKVGSANHDSVLVEASLVASSAVQEPVVGEQEQAA